MFQKTYRIELRQAEVKGLNARHYFWVLKEVLGRGRSRVLGELHGRPVNRKTGKIMSFSLGGDKLGFVPRDGEDFYDQSLKLPFAKAIQGRKEDIERRWAEGVRAGKLVNKTNTNYDPLGTNSNTVANTVGRAMGFEVQRISDTRTDAAQPFVPGIAGDLVAGLGGPQSPFRENIKPVGWNSKVEDRFGNEPDPAPFRDPFRDDIPF